MAKHLWIRKLGEGDKDRLRIWRNSSDVAPHMTNQHKISTEEHNRWFSKVRSDQRCRYWICGVGDSPVGTCSINNIDSENSHADWAMYIGEPEAQGSGLGTCIEYFILGYAFEVLMLEKLEGEILLRNEKVWKMHLRYGFTKDGQLRNHIRLPDGVFEDIVQISMLKDEWPSARTMLRERIQSRGFMAPDYLSVDVRLFGD